MFYLFYILVGGLVEVNMVVLVEVEVSMVGMEYKGIAGRRRIVKEIIAMPKLTVKPMILKLKRMAILRNAMKPMTLKLMKTAQLRDAVKPVIMTLMRMALLGNAKNTQECASSILRGYDDEQRRRSPRCC